MRDPDFTLSAGPTAVTVSSSTVSISSISIPFMGTSNGVAWLTASVSGSNTLNVSIANTSALALGESYTGTVIVRANGSLVTDSILNVTLQVGSLSGLMAHPPSWSPIGSGQQQTFTVTNNDGFIVPVVGEFVPGAGFPSVNVQSNVNGSVTLTIIGSAAKGSYSGTLKLLHPFFLAASVPVSLTIP